MFKINSVNKRTFKTVPHLLRVPSFLKITNTYWKHSYPIYISNISRVNYSNYSNPNFPYENAPLGTRERPLYIKNPDEQKTSWMNVMRQLISLGLTCFLLYIVLSNFGASPTSVNNPDDKSTSSLRSFIGPQEYTPVKNNSVTFADIKGIDEVKEEIEQIVEFLKDPDRFNRLGGKLPKGVLLVGKPGTGKTLLAKAIAGEAGRPFFYESGSGFDEMFVGVGARRIRSLFASARKHAPCIIFIDEIDSLGGRRSVKDPHFAKQSLNQLLAEMDGFAPSDGIIVIGATNLVDSLDPALIRPGRFDKHINVPVPDILGRKDILQLYLKKVPHRNLDIELISKKTRGFTGADIANLVNEAAIRASSKNKDYVEMEELEYAYDRITLGLENKSLSKSLTQEDNKITAYHEGGHALVTLINQKKELHKVTILPRGNALGVTWSLPPDSPLLSKQDFLANIDTALGGIVAEEIIFGKDQITSGATSDLQVATDIARQMVESFGMSALGPVDLTDERLRFDYTSNLSPQTKSEVDREIKRIINERYENVKNLLEQHRDKLHKIAEALLQFETLSGKEVEAICEGKPIRVNSEHIQ